LSEACSRAIAGAVLSLCFAAAGWGQVGSAVLTGEIRDSTGGVVPDAGIRISDESTRFSRSARSGSRGLYRLDDLRPGTYTLTVTKPGFRTVVMRMLAVEVNQTARADIELTVSAEQTSISVKASISPLQEGDVMAGYRLDAPVITSLPLVDRNIVSLVTLGPGAIPRQLGGFAHDVVNDIQSGPRGAVALNPPVNGARSTMNSFLFDGAYNTDRNTYAIAVSPPMESVQEFRIGTSQAGADFAQAGGGVVDVVSKQGGQRWHGGAFEFLRNEATDARNYFDAPDSARPIYRQSQFGAQAGGPAPVGSTFFFAAYEGIRGNTAKSAPGLVPTDALRGGDFSGSGPIFDPLSGTGAAADRQAFAGNVMPKSRIDTVARNFLADFEPLPNQPGGASNYIDSTPSRFTGDSVSGRVDRQFGERNWAFARYTMNDQRDRLASSFPVRPTSESLRAQQAVLAHTASRADWLNEWRFSFTRLRVFDVPESAFGTNVGLNLGIADAPGDSFMFGLPYFAVANYSMAADSPDLPQAQRDNTWSASERAAVARGRHTWKFGVEANFFQVNYLKSHYVRGQYTFTGAFTGNQASASSGDAFADFLLGFPQATNRNNGSPHAYLRQSSQAAYLQHDWRVTGSLWLNFGLRYEYISPYGEARNGLLNLDYAALPQAPALMSTARATAPDRNNFAPRAGIALRLPKVMGATIAQVFRAGYGVYYSPEIAAEAYDLVSNGIRIENNRTDGGTVPVLTLRNGFPLTYSTGLPSYFGLDRTAATPYVQQWTAGFQRELPSRIVLDVSYLGSKGTKLGRFRRFNTALHEITGENLPARPGDLQSLRPFPQLGTLFQRQHIANSFYHSLQLKAEKRMNRNLAFLMSVVWAKSIDDADGIIPGLFDSFGAQDERNLRLERGLSFFNVGRRISAGFTYNLPAAPAMRLLTEGWQLSGIVTLQDGTPLNPVYFAYDPANSGTPNRPDVVPGVSVVLPRPERSIERFFNTAAFQAPKPYTFGNAGRNILPGPGNNVTDVAVHRRFAVRESGALEFRAELFNAFNHPNWGIPGPYPDFGPFFGRIFSTGQPRRVQLGMRFDF
jgi:hypothetical protein